MLNSLNVKNMLMRDMETNAKRGYGLINYPLIVGDVSLSIQCSESHICNPRENTFISDYSTMEIGVDFDGLDVKIKHYIISNLSEHYVSNLDDFYVYGNVPVEKINELIIFIKSLKNI